MSGCSGLLNISVRRSGLPVQKSSQVDIFSRDSLPTLKMNVSGWEDFEHPARARYPKTSQTNTFIDPSPAQRGAGALRSFPLCLAGLRIVPSGVKVLISNDLYTCARTSLQKRK